MIQSFEILKANSVPEVSSFAFFDGDDVAGLTTGNPHHQTSPGATTSATLVTCPAGKQIVVWGMVMGTVGGGNSFVGTITESSAAGNVSVSGDFFTFGCNKNGMAVFGAPFTCTPGYNLVGCWCTGNTGAATTYANFVTFYYNIVDA